MCDGHGRHHCGEHRGACDCGGGFDSNPCFWTKEEKVTWLEDYLKNLQAEVKSVEERITSLKKES